MISNRPPSPSAPARPQDVSTDVRALQKLRREAERAKRALSSQHQVRVEIESLVEGVDLSGESLFLYVCVCVCGNRPEGPHSEVARSWECSGGAEGVDLSDECS